jgi:hypothetical protein
MSGSYFLGLSWRPQGEVNDGGADRLFDVVRPNPNARDGGAEYADSMGPVQGRFAGTGSTLVAARRSRWAAAHCDGVASTGTLL